MRTKMNNQAFSLVELMMAVAFSVLLMTGVYGFYNTASQTYSSGVSG
jgi:Tfp pilus assembly protein PilW